MKIASEEKLLLRLAELNEKWEVRLPLRLEDGTRAIGPLTGGDPALCGAVLPGKPTAAFFPQHEAVFSAVAGGFTHPPLAEKPLFIVGFTPRDLACLSFIDRFFADGWRDDIYFHLRDNAAVAGISGYCGANGALVPPALGDCDVEFFLVEEGWLVAPYSETGRTIAAGFSDEASGDALLLFQKARRIPPDGDDELLREAAELLRLDAVPDAFWQEIGERCIACGGCNMVCPTCTCFGVQDRRYSDRIERSRMWDSCQLDGFMREAGGHNPLGSEALRSRRRIHHKLAADRQRWGEISCFICGRCDTTCPTGIGMMAVARELVRRYS